MVKWVWDQIPLRFPLFVEIYAIKVPIKLALITALRYEVLYLLSLSY